MSQHTPGPWNVNEMYAPERKCLRPTPYILDGHNRHVAAALNGDPTITDDEHAANARLIAAAPEMLATLRSLMDRHTYPMACGCDSCEAARALLAKIEGQS